MQTVLEHLLHALVLLAAAAAATASARTLVGAGETSLTLGALLPLEIEHAPGVSGYRAVVEVAIEQINSDPDLLPGHTLLAAYGDTRSDERFAATAAQDLVSAGVAAVVGPVAGELSDVASFVTSHGGVTHIDALSPLTTLSSQEEYPFSARLSASSAAEAQAILKMCVAIGWRRVGVVTGTNAVAEDMTLALRDAAGPLGVEVATPVQVTFDPRRDPDEELGPEYDSFVSAIRDSHDVRIWVFNVGGRFRKAFHRRLLLEGLFAASSGFVWFHTANGGITTLQATELAEELGLLGNSWIEAYGDGGLRPLAASYDFSVESPLPAAVCDHVFGAGEWSEEQCARLPTLSTGRYLYDTVFVAAGALHELVETKAFCAAAADPSAHDNCTALAADAGSDDASLVRLVRGAVRQPRTPGSPIAFDPATGDRAAATVMVQLGADTGEGTLESRSLMPFVVPPGSPVAVRTGDDYWSQQGVAPPADRPSFVTDEVLPDEATFALLAALCAAGAAYCVACAALTLAYRKRPIIVMSSYRINLVSALGGTALLAVQLTGRAEFSTATCSARLWTMVLGFTLLFGPMFAKMWRVYRIFGSDIIKTVRITDRHLLEVVAALLAVDVLLLGAWQGVSPIAGQATARPPEATSDMSVYRVPVDEVCESEHDGVFYPLVFAWKGAILFAGSYVSFRTRGVKIKALNDSSHIALAIFATTMLAAVALPVSFLIDSKQRDASFVLLAGSTLVIVLVSITLLFVPKFVAIWGGTTDAWTVSSGNGTATTKAHDTIALPAKPRSREPVRCGSVSATPSAVSQSSRFHSTRPAAVSLPRGRAGAAPLTAGCGAAPSSTPQSPAPAPEGQGTVCEA